MAEESPTSPSSFKDVLNFFNSLERPPVPKRNFASNLEVNLKLVIDSKTIKTTSYQFQQHDGEVQTYIPRAKLIKKPLGDEQRAPKVPPRATPVRVPPKVPPRPYKHQSDETLMSFEGYFREQLTPDVEAKKILEEFTKEIDSFRNFAVPESALDSEFLKETLSIANSEVSVSEVSDSKRISQCSGSSYRLPERLDRNDPFLEPYLLQISDRHSSPIGATSPSPPPARIIAAPLPAPSSRSISRESLISSNGGSDASSEGSEEEVFSGYGATCDISLMERVRQSHPIWFLPGIQRAGAFHLLQGKEEGCFVVRKSSQTDTMALSVRLPPDKGPYIEHYLIHSSEGRLGLETSENRFVDVAALIAHYASCCDELPVQLTLPKAIRESKSRQQLSSLALLGQEFWSYSPPPSEASSPDTDLVLNLNPLMSTFKQSEVVDAATPKPTRPNTLNLLNKNDPNHFEVTRSRSSLKGDSLGRSVPPPPPPPRWSKPTTPQNNFTVTTTVTFSVNAQSPNNERSMIPSQVEVLPCDPKRMSPEGQCNNSTVSSRGSVKHRSLSNLTSPNSVLSPSSDSVMSPDTLSPLSVSKGARHSKRAKPPKLSKHYQESDIVDSPTMLYYKSGLGDKISDYEDVWTNEGTLIKPKLTGNNNNGSGTLSSPDILQNTPSGNVVMSLNNNVLSPTESLQNGGVQRSICSTPVSNNGSNKDHQLLTPVESSVEEGKQQSPFYAEPADSLSSLQQSAAVAKRLVVTRPAPAVPIYHRHSNPPNLNSMKVLSPTGERAEDGGEFNGGLISSSVDNLSPKQKFLGLRRPDLKPVLPPLVKPKPSNQETWQVDSSWKFVTNENDINMDSSDPDYESDWPPVPNLLGSLDYTGDSCDDRPTLHDLISKRYPDIRTPIDVALDDDRCRISAYDNVDLERKIPRAPPSEISELTEFSDPWAEPNPVITETDESYAEIHSAHKMKCASINRSRSFRDRFDHLLSSARFESLKAHSDPPSRAAGVSIRNYAMELAQDKSTTFAQNIDNFIACTCESKETNPQVVMRNMRQFMSGMKNYLVKHGEKGFYKEIERERNKLKSTEFLNLDAILEGVMHKLVVRPLKTHLHKLFLDYYTKTGDIRLLADNIQYASTRPIHELAVKPRITLPSESVLGRIAVYIQKLQQVDSPLEKLENLLAAIAIIFNSVKTNHQLTGSGKCTQLGADDFLPIFVWVLVKTNFVAAEIEAEYMWGLLHPSLFSGEGGYYLTTLSSAVHVLKHFKKSCEDSNSQNHVENDSVLKVVVPDELHGSILTKTVPARPQMTTKEVCKIIAHKARITNPQDYALYRLTAGEETMLMDNECPQDFMKEGKHTMLAYKRIDAKIAWPNQDKLNL
ncbi:protein sprint isoform X2 [Anthonomus grandis grandis]|uniref:protein sprint isoform X2 n=1 Tax=Anthonomus grandis grandis TaxID=2921223 RepID=UPI0021650802|nr:protein sprint isoform X2 [Anthonomus grandis grandis]